MITGKLVGLRAIEKEDLKTLRDWRNIPSLRRNFREYRELSLQNQEKWYENLHHTNDVNFMFMIERLTDHSPLGACGLLYTNWLLRAADFSLYIGFEGSYIDRHGYAKEAALLLLEYAFNSLNLNKVWMELYEFDTTKMQLFTEELGFKKDGILRDNCFEDGRYWNSYIISLTRKDLNNRRFEASVKKGDGRIGNVSDTK